MIKYDWRKIQRIAGRNPHKVIKAVRVLMGGVPSNKYDPLYPYYLRDFSGPSFLLNPEELLANDYFYSAKHIAEYIALASYRNFAQYKFSGDARLDIRHVPVNLEIIKSNKLLRVKDGWVYFQYEEAFKENTLHGNRI